MYKDPVSKFYNNIKLNEKINNILHSSTKEERKELLDSLRSNMDPISALVTRYRPDMIKSLRVF